MISFSNKKVFLMHWSKVFMARPFISVLTIISMNVRELKWIEIFKRIKFFSIHFHINCRIVYIAKLLSYTENSILTEMVIRIIEIRSHFAHSSPFVQLDGSSRFVIRLRMKSWSFELVKEERTKKKIETTMLEDEQLMSRIQTVLGWESTILHSIYKQQK